MQQKTLFLTLFLLTASAALIQAQGFFHQKKEILKKCMEQIALLRTQHSALTAGYHILNNSLELTSSLKSAEYTRHGDYYKSLNAISAPVKNDPEIKQILVLYEKMNHDRKAVLNKAVQSGMFSSGEITYLKGIYLGIMKAADDDMTELKLLITGGILQMTDSDRMEAIGRVSKNIHQKYKVLSDLNRKVLISLNGREAQKLQAETLRKLYGE